MKQVVTFAKTKISIIMRLFILSSLLFFFMGSLSISAQNQLNSNIKELVSKKRDYNKRFGFGYRIQLYNGNERRARSIKSKFRIEFPGIYSRLKYDTPDWKVQVGNYKTKLEADKSLLIFQKEFSGIIVIPMGK